MNEQIKILIIDKSIDFIQNICNLLTYTKYNVATDFYTEKTEALQACLTNAYDIIIVSYTINENDFNFIEKVLGYGCKTPLIYISEKEEIINGASDCLLMSDLNPKWIEKSIFYAIEKGKIMYENEHDKLTGLLNREAFLVELEEAINKSKKDKLYTFGVIFIDVDRFKYVNDSLGHNVGDALLIAVVNKIKSCLHRLDIIARYGGDEFSILLTGMPRQSIESYANKIKEIFNKPMIVDGYEFNNTVSVGAVIIEGNYSNTREIIRDADIAMYHNKNKEKNKPVIFDLSIRKSLERKFFLENEIRKSINKNEFTVVYQPCVDFNEKIVSLEALIRWKVNEINISPDEFIPIAEELYLIHNLSEIVINKVAKDIKEIKNDIKVSINISPKQLGNCNLVDYINSQIGSDRTIIEITESSLINGYKKVSEENILKFKSNGYKLYLDDYGTGYSALAHIINFPLDGIKIDKSLIMNIDNNNTSKNVVKSIIDLSRNLNMKIIAEGVENKDQRFILKNMKCDYYQGFLFSKPVDMSAIKYLLS